MSTGQKYVGGENSANSSPQSGENAHQMAESANSTVENQDQHPAASPTSEAPQLTLPANTFTFEELAIFDSMPTIQKDILLHMVHSESYHPEQLSQALSYLSQNPGVTSSEDEGLQAALLSPDPAAVEIVQDKGGDPTLVELPYFLRCQIRDAARTKNLFAAIERVFYEFEKTRDVEDSDEWVNQTLAYAALRLAFVEIVEKAAKQRGTYVKSSISDYLHSMPELSVKDEVLDNAPVLVGNPQETTDVERLQEWVSTLQQMCRLQQKINGGLTKQTANLESIAANQQQLIDGLNREADALKKLVPKQKNEERKLPKTDFGVNLFLSFRGGYDSPYELVSTSIRQTAEEKLKQAFASIAAGETEDAFGYKLDYDQLQSLLLQMSTDAGFTAYNNNIVATHQKNPSFYFDQERWDAMRMEIDREKFVKEYAISYDQEPTEPAVEADPEQPQDKPLPWEKPQE